MVLQSNSLPSGRPLPPELSPATSPLQDMIDHVPVGTKTPSVVNILIPLIYDFLRLAMAWA